MDEMIGLLIAKLAVSEETRRAVQDTFLTGQIYSCISAQPEAQVFFEGVRHDVRLNIYDGKLHSMWCNTCNTAWKGGQLPCPQSIAFAIKYFRDKVMRR
jgi:hypothetical protein